jgi:hypothetical protein
MRRFRLRTLRRVNAEALLIATVQNVKRLLTFSGGGTEEVGAGSCPAASVTDPFSEQPTPPGRPSSEIHTAPRTFFNGLAPSTTLVNTGNES